MIQSVAEEMRLQMLIGPEIQIGNENVYGLFANEMFQKRPITIVPRANFHFDHHFQ